MTTLVREAADSLVKASTPEPFSRSKTSNWVARGGGLPDYIQHIGQALMKKRGIAESQAIQMAIGIVKNWAAGKGKVDANTRAAAAKALAEWEKLKASNKAKKVAEVAVTEAELEELESDVLEALAEHPLLMEWPDELEPDALGDLAALEAPADDSGDGKPMPKVFCVKDRKKVTPTKAGNCPICGANLGPAIAKARKGDVSEAPLSSKARKSLPDSAFVFPKDKRYPIHDLPHARNALARAAGKPEEAQVKAAVYKRYPQLKKDGKSGVSEASSTAAPMSNVKRLPGESLASWGTRLKAGDAALAAKQKGRSKGASSAAKTRSGGSAAGQEFEKLHPRGRGGEWIVKSGSTGAATRAVQQKVGAKVDGQYGQNTKAAVERFQRQHHLQVDGEVGAQTIAAMKGQRNAAQVKAGAMSAADRTWLLSMVKKSTPKK